MSDSSFSLRNKKIWVAGHKGMIGSAITRRLSDYELIYANSEDLDLRKRREVREWVAKNKPDILIMCAAVVGGIQANSSFPVEFLLDNLKIQNNLIEAAADFDVQKILFFGSACTYPKNSPQPINEDALWNGPPEETNIWYATAKLSGIQLIKAYVQQNGLEALIVMPTNAYGPYDNFDNSRNHVIPALINRFHSAKVQGSETVTIWGSGRPKREFIFVDDLSDAAIFLLESSVAHDIVNIGSGHETTISELASLIAKVVSFKGNIIFDSAKPDGVMRKALNSSKLNGMGWSAKVSLEDGLTRTYDWAKHHEVLDH